MRSDQRSLGFRIGHCHVQLTSVDIYMKQTYYVQNSFLSGDPSKVCEFKKHSNRLNYLKNISNKAYFGKHFDLYKGNLKATWLKATSNH